MYLSNAMKVIIVGYQCGLTVNAYYTHKSMNELKEMNKKYTDEVSKLLYSLKNC
jgi:hypothetical protein